MRITPLAFTLFLSLGALVACGGTATKNADSDVTCAGEEKPVGDGCNTCQCGQSGWVCTHTTCANECLEGQQKAAGDGCNTCECKGGAWLCTRQACATECRDGDVTSASDGCNTCVCKNGAWQCTLMDCPSACSEGTVTSDGCNTCTCKGGAWQCTLVDCPPACSDGAVRFDGCNTCTCNSGQWACTDKVCETKSCGGFAGNTCSSSEYCAYEEGQMCGAADASAVCRPRPSACDSLYDPVCGCDGLSYGNACTAAMKGTGVMYKGNCAVLD